MAVSAILSKFGTPAALTITLASLASSTTNVGRQSTLVSNATTRHSLIHLYVKLKTATTSFAAGFGYVWLIRGDGTLRTDNAGASDDAFTAVNAMLLGALSLATAATTYQKSFWIADPGPEWGIAISHNTVAVLDSTAGSHAINWVGDNPEAQ